MGWMMRVVAVASVAVLVSVVGPAAGATPRATPGGTGFYTLPDLLPPAAPGTVIKAEQEPADPTRPGTTYRVMYHSKAVDGHDIAVTGLIAVPDGTPPTGGWPVVTWAHGTTGLADACAPSKSLDFEGSDFLVARGYEVVATDYEGLGTPGRHPYIVGQSEGRGVLDIVRAAENIPAAHASKRVLIWGHSQGGHAALWAGQIAHTWAPELDVVGTVAGAPPSQLQLVYQALKTSFFRYYLIMAAAGINAAYPQALLDLVLTPAAIARIGVVDTACGSDVGTPYAGYTTESLIKADPSTVQPWKSLIAAQEPGTVKTNNPILIIQGGNDEQIPVASSLLLENRMCGFGQVVSRRIYKGQSHAGVIAVADPEMAQWIADRFAGHPAPNDCTPGQWLDAASQDVLGQSLTGADRARALASLGRPTSQDKQWATAFDLAGRTAGARVSIDRAYLDLLGRHGGAAALDRWADQVSSGRATMLDVVAALAGSPEFVAKAGGTVGGPATAALVDGWFTKLVGRHATPAESSALLGRYGRAPVATIPTLLAHSASGVRYRLRQLFERYLHRAPTVAETLYLGTYYRQHPQAGEAVVTAILVASFEYDDLIAR